MAGIRVVTTKQLGKQEGVFCVVCSEWDLGQEFISLCHRHASLWSLQRRLSVMQSTGSLDRNVVKNHKNWHQLLIKCLSPPPLPTLDTWELRIFCELQSWLPQIIPFPIRTFSWRTMQRTRMYTGRLPSRSYFKTYSFPQWPTTMLLPVCEILDPPLRFFQCLLLCYTRSFLLSQGQFWWHL